MVGVTAGGLLNNADSLEGQIQRASEQPGPGQYFVPPMPKAPGGRMGSSTAKSGLEWELYRAAQIPGPSAYTPAKLPAPKGGRFTATRPTTDIEANCLRARGLPGPNDYDAVPTSVFLPARTGGSAATKGFSSGPQRPPLWNNGGPGPGQYVVPEAKTMGGSFSTAFAKTDLEWQIHFAKLRPGPSTYDEPLVTRDGHSARTAVSSGGTWNKAESKSGLEWAIHQAEQLPGPDYDVLATLDYLDGRSGPGPRKGATLTGRPGIRLKDAFAEMCVNTAPPQQVGVVSASHEATLTPWRQRRRRWRLDSQSMSGCRASLDFLPSHATSESHRLVTSTDGQGDATVRQNLEQSDQGKLEILFASCDKNADGELNTDGVFQLCKLLGKKLKPKELARAFRDMDVDCSGTVDIGEFRNWWLAQARLPIAASQSSRGPGSVGEWAAGEPDPVAEERMVQPEVSVGSVKGGHLSRLPQAELMVRKLFKLADVDGDDHLNLEEFRKLQQRCECSRHCDNPFLPWWMD